MYEGVPFSPSTQLLRDISSTAQVIQVADPSVFPDAPNYATIGIDEGAETIEYAEKTGNELRGCTRGIEGAPRNWNAATPIARNWTNKDYANIVANITGSGGVLSQTANAVTGHSETAQNLTITDINPNDGTLRGVELHGLSGQSVDSPTVTFRGVNAYDFDNAVYLPNRATLEINKATGTISAVADTGAGTYVCNTHMFPVEPNDVFYVQAKSTGDDRLILRLFDENFTNISSSVPISGFTYNSVYEGLFRFGNFGIEILNTSDIRYFQVGFVFWGGAGSVGSRIYFTDIQVSMGKPFAFEPFQTPSTVVFSSLTLGENDVLRYDGTTITLNGMDVTSQYAGQLAQLRQVQLARPTALVEANCNVLVSYNQDIEYAIKEKVSASFDDIYRGTSPALTATTGIAQSHTIADISPTWQGLRGVTMYGDTPQIGTPTPETPIPLVSVTDPTVTVDTTSAALAGITLNGVGAVKDTVDVTDDKVILTQRVQKRIFNGTESWNLQGTNANGIISFSFVFAYVSAPTTTAPPSLASHIPYGGTGLAATTQRSHFIQKTTSAEVLYVRLYESDIPDLAAYKAWLAAQYSGGTPLTGVYAATTPTVTDITGTSSGQALLALRGTYPTTVITCDTDCTIAYNQDINKAFQNLTNAVLAMGGNI